MEQVKENSIEICQYRSYARNFSLGVSTALKGMGASMRYMWPSMLLAVLLPIPFILRFIGQSDTLMRKWTETGSLPRLTLQSTRHEVWKNSLRSVPGFFFYLIVVLLVVGAALAWLLYSVSAWWIVGVVVVSAMLSVPLDAVFMEMSYTDRPLSECMGCLRKGIDHYAMYFSFSLLRAMSILSISLIGFLPFAVVCTAGYEAYVSYQSGDALSLPVAYPLVVFVAWVLGLSVYLVAVHISRHSRCLLWGSLVEKVPADSEVDGEGV